MADRETSPAFLAARAPSFSHRESRAWGHLFIGERKRSVPTLPTRSPMARVADEDWYVHHPRRARAAGVSAL